ncbi:hypothetical protein [Pseudoroseicyclus sp. CXY001]|uniref:hypothetical protein n=1 Tax=Pseudoroseicyclus sp. CXY001 TaxID=3242492 RepID=UPI0035716F13
MSPGGYVSGAGHAALIVWLLAGWGLDHEPMEFEVAEVSVVSAADYASIVAATTPQAEADLPPAPEPPSVDEEAEPALPEAEAPVETTAPEPQPEAPVEETPPPEAPEPPQEVTPPPTEAPDLAPEPEPEPEPEPMPEPEPEPEPAPSDLPVLPPLPEQQPDALPDTAPEIAPPPQANAPDEALRPQPRPADRIASEAAPDIDAAIAPEVTEAIEPEGETAEPEPEQEATAPEEAAPEIVTEAETPSGVLDSAPRPPVRPANLARATPAAASEEPPAAADDSEADALAEALAAAGAGASSAGAEPGGAAQLTAAEQDTFRVAVQGCWVLDPGSEAARVTVTVAFGLTREGRVESNQVVMIGNSGGTPGAVNSAFEAARRAVLRCQGETGYPLPGDKYDSWRMVEMTFNPDDMRLR